MKRGHSGGRMKHSRTMNLKRRDNMTTAPSSPRARMDTSHRNYTKDRREGGPFGA